MAKAASHAKASTVWEVLRGKDQGFRPARLHPSKPRALLAGGPKQGRSYLAQMPWSQLLHLMNPARISCRHSWTFHSGPLPLRRPWNQRPRYPPTWKQRACGSQQPSCGSCSWACARRRRRDPGHRPGPKTLALNFENQHQKQGPMLTAYSITPVER